MSVVARRYYLKGMAASKRGDWEGASNHLRSAVELTPRFTDARLAYVHVLCQRNDFTRAAQVVRAGLARTPTLTASDALWCTLADVLLRQGDTNGAEDALTQVRGDNFSARVASTRGRILAKQGQYASALDQFVLASSE